MKPTFQGLVERSWGKARPLCPQECDFPGHTDGHSQYHYTYSSQHADSTIGSAANWMFKLDKAQ